MKTKFNLFALATLALLSTINYQLSNVFAQGTAFTYQGQLQNNGTLANGTFNLQFLLYSNNSGGTAVAGPVTTNGVEISNGLFTVTMDFGASVWNGETNWLQIEVETNGGAAFTTLSPRQELTPTPYSIFAESADAAGLSGTVPTGGLSGTYTSPVSFNNPSNSFTGNGVGLTNVNAATLGGLSALNFWQLGGNTVTSSQFIGTLNNQPFDVYVDGIRGLRLIFRTDASGQYSNAPNIIGGSSVNLVKSGVVGGTVGGGGGMDTNGISYPNQVNADFGTISGGLSNNVSGPNSFIGGGQGNSAEIGEATISGGFENTANQAYTTIGGGFQNTASGVGATVGGGLQNISSGFYSTVAGGLNNTASGTNNGYATVAGGYSNVVTGDYSAIGGGYGNIVTTNYATVGGGENNGAAGRYSTVPGGGGNIAAGAYSFAAGHGSTASNPGSFVWSDDSGFGAEDALPNQFVAQASGGFFFFTGVSSEAELGPGATSWTAICDRNAKKNFQPVDTVAVLNKLAAVPIEQWNYKWEKDSDTPNIGPMAQDFKAAFYPGRDDKGITTLEFDGVELAAIQGLNEKVEVRSEKAEVRMQKLEAENAELKRKNDSLEKRLEALEQMILKQKQN